MISQSLLMPSIIINTSSKILFYDANNQMINKIKVTATRDSDPFLKVHLYCRGSWAIYAVDLDIKGYRMKEEFVDVMTLKQNFGYNKTIKSG
jgi:hypothetical protein